MKITVDSNVFTDAISKVSKSLTQRSHLPILSGILIEAKDKQIYFSCFDYETSTKIRINDALIKNEGIILISGRMLNEISRRLPNEIVNISSKTSNKIEIESKNSKFTLLSMPVDDYPRIPEFPPTIGRVPYEEFKKAILQVSIAVSKEDSFSVLNSICIEFKGNELIFLATDRYRLAMCKINWIPGKNFDIRKKILVKTKILINVVKMFCEYVDIGINVNSKNSIIGFCENNNKSTSILVEGDYPPIDSLFAQEVTTSIVLETSQFIESINRISLAAEKDTSLCLEFKNKEMILSAGNGSEVHAVESLQNINMSGQDIVISINYRYLLQGLSVLGTEYAKIAMTSAMRPIILTGQKDMFGKSEDDYHYLIMPVRSTK